VCLEVEVVEMPEPAAAAEAAADVGLSRALAEVVEVGGRAFRLARDLFMGTIEAGGGSGAEIEMEGAMAAAEAVTGTVAATSTGRDVRMVESRVGAWGGSMRIFAGRHLISVGRVLGRAGGDGFGFGFDLRGPWRLSMCLGATFCFPFEVLC
jgi:hypothetical protein